MILKWYDKFSDKILIVWPTAIYYKVKDMLSKAYQQPDEFFVSKNDLLERKNNVEEIELQELVSDPLNAVPDLPFGHLNKAWNIFLKKRRKDDVIWTFSANRTSEWGRKELRTGYVLVRSSSVWPYFLKTWQYIE
ncbi:hypothetical protein CCP3SC5AM1_1080004 [Gammaproteobacteria bacterium]